MKTALQELIGELENFKNFPLCSLTDKHAIEACIDFAKMRLETEKEQIVKAHEDGYFDGYNQKYPTHARHYHETYFNQTFKP